MKKMRNKVQKEWNLFVKKFDKDYVKNKMTLDEYVIGKGNTNKSFCYIVERELDSLGGIRGATAAKFGLYYGAKGDDKTKKYRVTKRFGDNVTDAFELIKNELANLIEETQKLSKFKEVESKFNGMFKYKVMYLYNPDIMLPSFYDEDLKYFAEKLGLKPKKKYADLQNQLMDYKKNNEPETTNHEFMVELYSKYGRPITKDDIKYNDNLDDELNELVRKEKKVQNYTTHISKKKPTKKNKGGIEYYPRDPKMAAIALKNSNCKCENNKGHYCFIRKKDKTRYTEVHHLIPLCFYKDFENDLDVPENIVSLCSNCHNEIHYGEKAKDIIINLYNQRKDKLKKAGIEIKLDDLLKKYQNISNKRD